MFEAGCIMTDEFIWAEDDVQSLQVVEVKYLVGGGI